MAGFDFYAMTGVAAGNWSDTVTYTPPGNGQPASVTVGSLNIDPVSLQGTVTQPGDAVIVTFTLDGAPFQLQLAAVCDIVGGTVCTDGYGGYFLFSSGPLLVGATYHASPGFGLFDDGPPQPACFVVGTCIETDRGFVPVEALRPGDRVRTLLGAAGAPVVWTGRRRIDCAAEPDPARFWPVRVRAGAFGRAMPSADLLLSPDHAVFVEGVLVPIRYLVNDASIAVEPMNRVEYWHIELPAHDAVLAEGLPAESYLDTGNRGGFDVSWGRPSRRPEEGGGAGAAWATRACAPLVLDPARHVALRSRLAARARALGFRQTPDAALRCLIPDVVAATCWDGARATALLPAGTGSFTLDSRSVVPGMQAGGEHDGRRLGVAVRSLRVGGRAMALDDPALARGWHQPESGFRWTNGRATVLIDAVPFARRVDVLTAPMLRYWHADAAAFAHRREVEPAMAGIGLEPACGFRVAGRSVPWSAQHPPRMRGARGMREPSPARA